MSLLVFACSDPTSVGPANTLPNASTTGNGYDSCKRFGQTQTNTECVPAILGADMRLKILEEATRLQDSWPVGNDCHTAGANLRTMINRVYENPSTWHETIGEVTIEASGQFHPDITSDPGPEEILVARNDPRTGSRRQWGEIQKTARHEALHTIKSPDGSVKYGDLQTVPVNAYYMAQVCGGSASGGGGGGPIDEELYSLPGGGIAF